MENLQPSPSKGALRNRRYYARHRERLQADGRILARAKYPRHKINLKAWRAKNKPRLASYRKKDADAQRNRVREWRLKNPSKWKACSNANSAKRRARIRGVLQTDLGVIAKWEIKWRTSATVACYWCQKSFTPDQCESDHVFPISRGGDHSITNLCVACNDCNGRKYCKSIAQWNLELSQLVLAL